MEYQLKIKQIVDYPRCRIYRDFISNLIEDKNIRTNGSSYLFYFITLCSKANYKSSYRKIEGVSYLVSQGEWVCKVSDLIRCFRFKFQHQVFSILDYLERQHYITYSRLGRGNVVKFSIVNWKQNNTVLEYNYPCQKDTGFFFFPIAAVHELISLGKCSEMDMILDMWIHCIYNDIQVQGSEVGPVVYFRNLTGNPLINYKELGVRWGISKASVCRVLNKLAELDYISLISFTGKHGSVIYLKNYLSTMFSISDVMIDKEEVSMVLNIPIHISDDTSELKDEKIVPSEEQIVIKRKDNCISPEELCILKSKSCVSESHIKVIVRKVVGILSGQGIACCDCRKSRYILSDCKNELYSYTLEIMCPEGDAVYRFELNLKNIIDQEQVDRIGVTKYE